MSFSRSNLIVVVDGLSAEQLANLGQQIKELPVPPIVTLVKTVPILNKDTEEQQWQAKHDLATAKEKLNIPAASEIVQGSNPRSAETFFKEGPFDAMIKRGSNGQPAIFVKNLAATGIQELTDSIPVVIDVSEHKAFQHSYKGVFAKPSADVIGKNQPIALPQNSLKPRI